MSSLSSLSQLVHHRIEPLVGLSVFSHASPGHGPGLDDVRVHRENRASMSSGAAGAPPSHHLFLATSYVPATSKTST